MKTTWMVVLALAVCSCGNMMSAGALSVGAVAGNRYSGSRVQATNLSTVDDAMNPLFGYTRTEALAMVTLRDNHENLACKSPVAFLESLRAALRQTDLGAGFCTVAVLSPTDESGVSLEFRCPLSQSGPFCKAYFDAIVWLELEREDGPNPYIAQYSLAGVSKGYLKCRRDPGKPGYVNEAAVRKLYGVPRDESRHGGAFFERQAEGCM